MPINITTLLCGAALLATTCMTHPASAATAEGAITSGHPVSFTVALPLRNKDQLETLLDAQQTEGSSHFHKWLTPAQFGAKFGPTTASMNRVIAALTKQGFTVTAVHTRSLSVTGPAGTVQTAFGTPLRLMQARTGATHVAATGVIHTPASLAAEGAFVVGLEGLEHHVHSRSTGAVVDNRFSPTGNYYFTDLKQAYVYPSAVAMVTPFAGGAAVPFNGTGATIGVVISSDVLDSDIKSIFDHEHYATTTGTADPTLYARRLVNGGNAFNDESDDSFEASLDVQAEMGGAPGAHVVLYNMPSLYDSDIIDAYTAVIDDDVVDAVSSSFGECESYYLAKYNGGMDLTGTLAYEHELYEEGNSEGITFLASSGDSAGKECISTSYFNGKPGAYIAGASTPATDPNVTAVGGTNVVTEHDVGTLESNYGNENAWLDQEAVSDPYGFGNNVTGAVWGAGGGASVLFAAPAYQALVTTGSTMRMTPDIGMQVGGCPGGATDYNPTLNVCNGGNRAFNGNGNTDRSDYTIYFGGGRDGVIGTSVASPEFTGALAMLIEKSGRQGNLNAYIYKTAALQAKGGRRSFHTLIPGYNGVVQSNVSPTFNVSTGVGTPIVKAFINAPGSAAAGTPQSPSNP